ncbi:MAG: hypothetical protein JXR73_21430 [Candidatus Omnitrophica bacterium]|nr:hypothetical protein [Candidatus Omnitrophota bacterium]
MEFLNRFFFFFLIVLSSQASYARVLCPRVSSEHTADVSDWKRFREFHEWKDKTGQDLALAVWQYLCGYETGVYHFNEILEGDDPFNEYATVRDPQKILNIYNMAYCGIFGPVLDGVFQNIGFTDGRSFGIDLWNHCASEVWYEGKWHYYDLDVRGLLLDAEGNATSLKEAQTRRDLWIDPPVSIQPFFPKDPDKNKVFEIYRDSQVNYYYRWFEGSHTMDYSLRQGESFTRWWTPQGGRWNHRARYNETPWLKELILTEPIGMKPNHRSFTRWNHGNGLFHYEPNLTDQSSDFEDGVLSSRNLRPGAGGLEFINDGAAELIFDIFTPYIIVAKINDIDDPQDDSEALIAALLPHSGAEISVSLDHGLTWDPAGRAQAGRLHEFDLTRWAQGTYGCQVKLAMNGKAEAPALETIRFDTWVQVAPISIPRLKQGVNRLRYDIGDRYGKKTEPILIKPDTADPEDLNKYLVETPKDYDPDRHTERIHGDAILHLKAPDNQKISWFSAGATFRTYQGENAWKTRNRIAYAAGRPERFHTIYESHVPAWANHWRCNWDEDVVLEEPVNEVFVQFTGDPGLNIMRACLHVTPRRAPSNRAVITHGFKTGGVMQTRTIEMDRPGGYAIECESPPENVFIKIAVPSR